MYMSCIDSVNPDCSRRHAAFAETADATVGETRKVGQRPSFGERQTCNTWRNLVLAVAALERSVTAVLHVWNK